MRTLTQISLMGPTRRVQCRPSVGHVLSFKLDDEVAAHMQHALEARYGAETPLSETGFTDVGAEGVGH